MVYNILAWLLPSKAVDLAIRGLVKASAALNAAEQRQHAKVAAIETELSKLRDLRSATLANAQRAGRIAKNIGDLIA